TDDEIRQLLKVSDDERIFVVYEALKRNITPDDIFEETKIDRWFLYKMKNLANAEIFMKNKKQPLSKDEYKLIKKLGFLDSTIEKLTGFKPEQRLFASYKMVDTCAAEFEAKTPYFYSSYDEENEAKQFIENAKSNKKKVIVFGSGPIRIGQGIEFDYCSVHCVWTLKELGYEAVIANNNPETVSTDFDTADRLYFDPLTREDVEAIIKTEQPFGAIVQFGGQTAIKLAKHLQDMGVNILGTSNESIDRAEDREKFDELLEKCKIPRPVGHSVYTEQEALLAAEKIGYPVLMRPSYVLGGQNMIIARGDQDIIEYMKIITAGGLENPVLIDRYLQGKEVEVDAIGDGEDYLIPG
ncbi:MAG: carbamoyl-phosphate synthase large subunit, partial [Oscillospiraceae bacterium]